MQLGLASMQSLQGLGVGFVTSEQRRRLDGGYCQIDGLHAAN
jgi:hypothetical protein